MPGIITHNIIFNKSTEYLKRHKDKNPYSKSVEALFNNIAFKKAGLFGAIGPDIFDFIPFINKSSYGGSRISYLIHDKYTERILLSMIDTVLSSKDHNSEWSATQRSYLYGFISHIYTDSIINPFIFYRSGFLSSNSKIEMHYFREQYLLHTYNMDMYFLSSCNNENYYFNCANLFPLNSDKMLSRINPAVKHILIKAINETNPNILGKLAWFNERNSFYVDIIPYLIKLTHKIKKCRNPFLMKLFDIIKRKKIFFSDILIRYPISNRVNTHVLNFHRERWHYPSGSAGLHYESVDDLVKISTIKITDIWERIESKLYTGDRDISDILNQINTNAFTGVYGNTYDNMYIHDHLRLK